MKIANVLSKTSVTLHKKETPKYLRYNVSSTFPRALCSSFMYYVIHAPSYTMRTGSFPGVKRLGRGADHPHSSSAEVKERVELYLYSPSGLSWPVLG
jgi:hypothetical protein